MSRTYHAHDFARLAGITVRTLHHYDRLGLLKPAARSAAGYRLYSDRDLARLEQVVALKFIGFPLNQIRDLLSRKEIDLASALSLQRRILTEKREHLDRAIRAIGKAEQTVRSAAAHHDWDAFRSIIEVIQMQNRKEWMKKYFTPEQLANLSSRWSPEVQEQANRDWAELIKDAESAIAQGEDPQGEVGRKIGARRNKLIAQFTGGDAGIAKSLCNLYADESNWPSTFKRPYSDEVAAFFNAAGKKGD
jgi:DNA-binding transcriptional MerR regulator